MVQGDTSVLVLTRSFHAYQKLHGISPEMATVSAFETGKLYCFQNAADDNYLNLYFSLTAEDTMIHTWPANWSTAQKWKAQIDVEDVCHARGHKLVTAVPVEMTKVLHMIPHNQNCRTVLKTFAAEPGQYWKLVKCAENENYLIIETSTGKALSNMGTVHNCRAVNPDVNDLHQQWKLKDQ